MIDRQLFSDKAWYVSGAEPLNRDIYSALPRKLTIGQRQESGIPSNAPTRTLTLTNFPQFPLLGLGGEDSPQGTYDFVQTGYRWTQASVSGGSGTGAGSSTVGIGRRSAPVPAKAIATNGAGGGGTGFEESCVIEIPGLLGEILWQGQTSGTSTTLVTPQPKRGYWVPGCLFVVLGRWRSGGASSFTYTMSNGQQPILGPLMGNITGAMIYRYLPGSRPTCTVVYARSVFASLQALIIR